MTHPRSAGCQYSGQKFTGSLKKDQGIQISMDAPGSWWDKVFIEQLWWSLKYMEIYLPPMRPSVLYAGAWHVA